MPFIHRDVGTEAELEHYLAKWSQKRYSNYSLAYLAFHGTAEHIWIGRSKVTLDEIEAMLAGKCAGRVLYFGSCSTLDLEDGEIDRFRRAIGARAVCGYVEDVDWLESAAFELLLIDALTYYERIDAAFNYLHREYRALVDKLGLRSSWQRRAR